MNGTEMTEDVPAHGPRPVAGLTHCAPPTVERPCMHPRADHQHGTLAAYRADGCRCEPCSVANESARRTRAQQRMNDDWSPFTPAAPVREHLERLRCAGVGV